MRTTLLAIVVIGMMTSCVEDRTKYVVEFPCESPEGSDLAKDMSAVEQL